VTPAHAHPLCYIDGDPRPVAIARLVRNGRSAEMITALVSSDNRAALALLRRILNALNASFDVWGA
jgi:hypothetical protein